MILAAGRGERMRPLTEHTPKPLLKAGGKALIEYHIERLTLAGVSDIVINIAYLGEQIRDAIGSQYTASKTHSASIHYSIEPEPLETAGAILHALPLLGDDPFLLVNGDVWTDYPYDLLLNKTLQDALGHLVLVDNPSHNLSGDYSIVGGTLSPKDASALTFSGISLLSPELIQSHSACRKIFPLNEVFAEAIENKMLSAEYFTGQWWDIGTVERLRLLDSFLS